jgi:hypothetical protein
MSWPSPAVLLPPAFTVQSADADGGKKAATEKVAAETMTNEPIARMCFMRFSLTVQKPTPLGVLSDIQTA